MNAVQMQYDFESKLKAHKKLQGMHLATNDIQIFLNDAQEILMRKHLELYDKEADSRRYLTQLITTSINPFSSGYITATSLPNSRYFALAQNTQKTLKQEQVIITSNLSVITTARVIEVTPEYYNLNINNPFKQPYKDLCWRMNYGLDSTNANTFVVQIIIPANFTLSYYNLTYIAYPIDIDIMTNTTSQLDKTIHPELVKIAVDLALKSISNHYRLEEEKKTEESQ